MNNFLFGTYTYLEKMVWSIVNIFPKSLRKVFYKLIFANFGKNITIDEGCYFRYPWKISIGDNTVINRGCEFYPSVKNAKSIIKLCDGVILGPKVIFFGAGQDPSNPAEIDVSGSIVVQNNAYIGGNSTIRYGVTIGDSSVIGAGSVITKNVGENSVVAGNPARVIR